MNPAPPVLFVPAVQWPGGDRKPLSPSGVTVKGKYTHMDGALLAALFLGRSFCFFREIKPESRAVCLILWIT